MKEGFDDTAKRRHRAFRQGRPVLFGRTYAGVFGLGLRSLFSHFEVRPSERVCVPIPVGEARPELL
jgi:hypothetical protein